jgi:hypothetical protein
MALPARVASAPRLEREALASALAGTPHQLNAGAGGFYARLFAGPGALTASQAPAAAAAGALAAGALLCGGLLLAGALARRRPAPGCRDGKLAGTVCLALAGALLLSPTTPRSHLALVGLCLVPWLDPALPAAFQRSRDRWLAGGLALAGYALAATPVAAWTTAAAAAIDRWPVVASVPTAGLALLAISLALWTGRDG